MYRVVGEYGNSYYYVETPFSGEKWKRMFVMKNGVVDSSFSNYKEFGDAFRSILAPYANTTRQRQGYYLAATG